MPLLQLLRGLERQVELLLHRFGVGVAAHRDVAGEHRLLALKDVDVDRAGAGVEQHDDLRPGRSRSSTSKAFCSAKASTSTMTGVRPACAMTLGVVADLVLLGGDEQHFHAAARVRAGAGVEDLVVEVDVLDVERDVLLGLPVDRLVQLRLGHHRQA